jgi:Zn-dependent protease with chaperone function
VEPQDLRRSALRAWYRGECFKQADIASGLAGLFRGYIYLVFVPLFGGILEDIFLIAIAVRSWDSEAIFPLFIANFVLLVRILITAGTVRLVREHRHAFERAKRAGRVQEIVRVALPDVWRLVEALAAAMGIRRHMMTLWYSSERSASASVQVDERGRADLVIPSGLAVLASREPARAEVILAHELGHVRQGDSEVIRLNAIYGRASKAYFGLLVIGLLFMFAYVSVGGTFRLLEVVASVGPFALLVLVQGRARSGLQRAEELADVAAVTYADPGLCAAMLRGIGSNGGEAGDDLGAYRFDRWQRLRNNTAGIIDWNESGEPIPPGAVAETDVIGPDLPTPADRPLDRKRVIRIVVAASLIVLLIELIIRFRVEAP